MESGPIPDFAFYTMKLHSHNRLVDTNVVGEAVDFGIDQEDAQGLTILLRDTLYEDKELAPIREYIANAFDANKETAINGVAKPINVCLPTTDNPQFHVRDFGPGLTHEEVHKIFTRYGKSTKRDSNDATGCFGIGSKSYAAYTDKATVISYQGTHKYTYIMYLDQNQQAKLKDVSKEEIEFHSTGLEIIWGVQLEDIESVKEKFYKLAKYWDTNEFPVVVTEKFHDETRNEYSTNIVDLDKHLAKYSIDTPFFKIEANAQIDHGTTWCHKSKRWKSNSEDTKLIMGPITYPLNAETIDKRLSEKQKAFLKINGLVLKVPLGTLSVAASREGLSYDSITIAAISSLLESCLTVYEKSITDQISKSACWLDAYLKAQELRNNMPSELRENMEFSYNNLPLKYSLSFKYNNMPDDLVPHKVEIFKYYLHETRNSKIMLKKDTVEHFNADTNKIFIVCDANKVNPHQAARKIKWYLLDQWERNQNIHWSGRADLFEAYAIWINDPKVVNCIPKSLKGKHARITDMVPVVLSLTELPEWFEDLKSIQCADIEVPKVERQKTKSGVSKPSKILKINYDSKYWRGAISTGLQEYDLTKNLCTLVTSHYNPSLQDLKSEDRNTIKINSALQYTEHLWDGSPKFLKKFVDKIGNLTVMPIRASELSKKANKNIPSVGKLAVEWAVSHIKSLGKDARLLCIDLDKTLDRIKDNVVLSCLLRNQDCYEKRHSSNWSDHSEVMAKAMRKIKNKRICKAIHEMQADWQKIEEIQKNEDTKLAIKLLFCAGVQTTHRASDIDEFRLNHLPKLFKGTIKNPLKSSIVKMTKAIYASAKILTVIHVNRMNYYYDRNNASTVEDIQNAIADIGNDYSELNLKANPEVLISIINKEL